LKNGKTLSPPTFNSLDCDPKEVFVKAEKIDKDSSKKVEIII